VSLVLDASLIAAWVLPDEHVPAADRIIAGLQPPVVVPSIFPLLSVSTMPPTSSWRCAEGLRSRPSTNHWLELPGPVA